MSSASRRAGQVSAWAAAIGTFVLSVGAPVAAAEPGTLDESFSGDGVQTIDVGSTDYAGRVFVDRYGRVTLVGASGGPASERIAVARLLKSGQRDRSFGNDGVVLRSAGSDARTVADSEMTADNALVILGTTREGYYLIRLNGQGRLDTSFGAEGMVRAKIASEFPVVHDLLVLPSGAFFVLGEDESGSFIRGYRHDGAKKWTFADRGILRLPSFEAYMLLWHADKRLLVIGREAQRRLTVLSFTGEGKRDESYGSSGRASLSIGRAGFLQVDTTAASVDDAGRLMVVSELEQDFETDITVARFHSDGTPDVSFGDGRAWRRFDLGPVDSPRAVTALASGKVLIAGSIGNDLFGENPTSDLFVLGLRSDGMRWSRFGSNGLIRTDFGYTRSTVGASDTAADGDKIVVSGAAKGNMLAVRYWAGH